MNITKFNFNKRTKLLVAGLLLNTLIIGGFGYYVVSDVQNKTDKSYAEFAQLMTKSIAAQTSDIISLNNPEKSIILEQKLLPFVDKNEDISYIEFKDKKNNILYSSKADISATSASIVSISSPVIFENKIIGSVTVGMTGKSAKISLDETKKSLGSAFVFTWGILSFFLILNFLFMSKELKKIYEGVRQIATGQFGYKLESENMSELADAFNDMSKLLSIYEEQNIEQLTLERNKLEAVLMSIINGVVVCDNFDNVVLSNSAALSMLDIEEKDFINTKIQDFIDCHGQKCFLDKIEEFKDTPLNIIEQKPIEFNIDDGKRTIKAMISPMFSKQQDYVGYIIVLIDITRETEVNKLKNTFISNVSHELRTPVTVLRTYIDTLCHNGDDFDEETKKEFMQTIDTEAKRLHSMVNDILDFSRLESGNVQVRKEFSDLVALLEQNINSIKILADEKNIRIHFDKENNLPTVPINVESIDRVIRNLLSNAIKYSPEGREIFVKTSLSEDKESIYFSVRDTGIGIAKEHLEKIFDRFYRVENATHTVKGTGLGLHLVKMTIEKHHNGKITVTSKENEGSEFTVLLPLTIDEDDLV